MIVSVGFETFYKAAKGVGAEGGLFAAVYYVIDDPYISLYLPIDKGVVMQTSVLKDGADQSRLQELMENGVPCVNVLV